MSRLHARAAIAAGVISAAMALGSGAVPAYAVSAPLAPLRGVGEPGVIAGRYVVVLESERSDQSVGESVAESVGLAQDAGAEVTHTYRETIHGYAAVLTGAELAEVREDPAVAYVEADRLISIEGTRTAGSWGQDRIDQRSGTNGEIVTEGSGAGVTAYVIDTGIRSTHADFGGRVAAGFSAVADGNGTSDCNGHGTHVAGTIGAGTYGVAPGVTLVPVRVLDCTGSGLSSGVIAGVDWVTRNHVPDSVANLSLGGSSFTALDNAVAASISSGVTYTVAAGNSTEDACNESPARLPQAITVAASTQGDGVAGFSNLGSCVDLYAPGQYIVSTMNTSDTATASLSGTSMAAPHVAGAAALYLQAHRGSTPAQVTAAVLGDATQGALTGVPGSTPNVLLYTGASSGAGGSAGTPTAPIPTTEPVTKPMTGKAYCHSLRAAGQLTTQSSVAAGKSYTTRRAGTHYGCLTGPRQADFDLVLSRRSGSTWVQVAAGWSRTATESVAYTGKAGRYRWQVLVVTGHGGYRLQVSHPS